MAEKKTTKKVLSERALELVMLNVLGGPDGILLQPQKINQDCVEKISCQQQSGETSTANSLSLDSANPSFPVTDQKLNS